MTDRGSSFDEKSIKDLCAPLSAQVLPEDALATWFGNAGASRERILANQRNAVANKRYVNRTRKKRKVK
jgi:hypothetical protein